MQIRPRVLAANSQRTKDECDGGSIGDITVFSRKSQLHETHYTSIVVKKLIPIVLCSGFMDRMEIDHMTC